jgi:hypothetical protein
MEYVSYTDGKILSVKLLNLEVKLHARHFFLFRIDNTIASEFIQLMWEMFLHYLVLLKTKLAYQRLSGFMMSSLYFSLTN